MVHRPSRMLRWSAPLLSILGSPALAEVSSVDIESRTPVLEGAPFGSAGPYEKLRGIVRFRLDPRNPHNAAIVDLDRAPTDQEGLVEAWADLLVLRPVDPSLGSGTALLEVSNRGGKASLAYFNRARGSSDPVSAAHFGDGFLMRRGLTVIWVGWQFDVPEQADRLRLHVPTARGGGDPIEGLVRSDWVVDQPTRTLALGHRNHVPYPVVDPDHPDNVLTVRDGRLSPRRVVPPAQWRFAVERDGELVDDRSHVHLPSGFEAGRIYELVYRAADPAVVGLGLAAIRDVMSYAKHDASCPFAVERGMAVGISQTGRFLRHFLYQGFNTDEQGRQVYDGLLVHSAGAGRGSFNHRFAQPSRDAHRYSAFFYPTDVFPFSGRTQRDPLTGGRGGILARHLADGHLPRIFYTNTGYEYWGRAASLLHTSLDGSADVEPLPCERIYHLASGQHYVGRFPSRERSGIAGSPGFRGNPLDFLPAERALLAALQEWVEDDVAPPPSAFPRVDDATLVPLGEVAFPRIAGVDLPRVAHGAYRADYGPRWDRGIVTVQPPRLGPAFPTLVPDVDALGNERAGVGFVEVLAPLATYTPWRLRVGLAGGNGELSDFEGTFVPLPATEDDRRRTTDPRPSIEALYGGKEDYLERAARAARTLVGERFLLEEDVERVIGRAERTWDWIVAD